MPGLSLVLESPRLSESTRDVELSRIEHDVAFITRSRKFARCVSHAADEIINEIRESKVPMRELHTGCRCIRALKCHRDDLICMERTAITTGRTAARKSSGSAGVNKRDAAAFSETPDPIIGHATHRTQRCMSCRRRSHEK